MFTTLAATFLTTGAKLVPARTSRGTEDSSMVSLAAGFWVRLGAVEADWASAAGTKPCIMAQPANPAKKAVPLFISFRFILYIVLIILFSARAVVLIA